LVSAPQLHHLQTDAYIEAFMSYERDMPEGDIFVLTVILDK